jgi:hypothetical protein
VDAGRIATGRATIKEPRWDIFRDILEGRELSEDVGGASGLGNALSPFNPEPVT